MRRSTSLLLVPLLALGGCFGGGFELFPDDTELEDNYGTFGSPVRASYALGAPVEFLPHLADEDVGATTDIQIVGDGLVEVRREGASLYAQAEMAGSGELVFSLRGGEVSRTPYRVQATDRFAYRWVFDTFGREPVFDDFVVAQNIQAELVVDYYAGDTRLYGRDVTVAGDGGTVEVTNNNDRLIVDTSIAGPQTIELTADGGATDVFAYEVVDSIARITIEREDSEDSIRLHAVATDTMGRTVRSPVEWTLEGDSVRLTRTAYPRGTTMRVVTATLLDAEATIEVPVDPS